MNDLDKTLCRPAFVWGAALTAGVAAGGAASSGGEGPMLFLPVLALIALFLAGLISFGRSRPGSRMYLGTVWVLTLVFAVSGFFRIREEAQPCELDGVLQKGTDASVSGIADYISVRPDGYRITLKSAVVTIAGNSFDSGGIMLSLGRDDIASPEPGDTITATGRIYPFEKATNPGQFDSYTYYRVRGLEARFNASGAVCGHTGGHRIKKVLYHIRTYLSDNIFRILPEAEASVLNSILTGDRGMLDGDLKDLYSEGGIAHILSISSLHVSLLGLGLYRLLIRILSRMRLSIGITLFVLYCYLILTGGSVSTTRAVIMITVLLISKLIGKSYDLLNAAGAAAVILLLYRPLYIYDTGFKLSFLAVFGIFAAGEVTRIWKIKDTVARSLIMSFAVWLFTLPAVINTYFCVNLLSILVNVIILPMMSILLVAGYFAAATGLAPVAGPVYYILRLYTAICEAEKTVPFARPVTGAAGAKAVAAYYAVLLTFLMLLSHYPMRKKKGRKKEKKRNLPVLLVLLGCAVIFTGRERSAFYAAFLDVGQGDAIYFEAEGETCLMDAGSSSVTGAGRYRVIPFLKHRGVRKLDHVFISHGDRDHTSAIKEILELGYPEVGELVVGVNFDTSHELIVSAGENGIPVRYAKAGDELLSGALKVLAPEEGKGYSDANSGSLVALLESGGMRLLLTGDSGFESESLYSQRLGIGPQGFTILKCAHHGSKYSTSEGMLEVLNPSVTVISCYKYNNYGHPNPLTLDRLNAVGSDVYCTADSGAVLIRAGDMITVEEYRRAGSFP